MIQSMKKVTFLVFHKEYDTFLHQLQQLGVMHIQQASTTANKELRDTLDRLEAEQARVDAMLSTCLLSEPALFNRSVSGDSTEAVRMLAEMEATNASIVEAQKNLDRVNHDVETLLPWGDFNLTDIDRLARHGIKMIPMVASRKVFDKKLGEYSSEEISRDDKNVYFVVFSNDNGTSLAGAEEVALPRTSLSEAQSLSAKYAGDVRTLTASFNDEAKRNYGTLKTYSNQLANRIQFVKAQIGTDGAADDKVKVLEGWFPHDAEATVSDFLTKSEVYYEVRDPQPTDVVPIKFNNDRFSRMFERLTRMYGFPTYGEWDPTPILAIFFTLFFAICMGDAGYGLVITLYGLFGLAGKTKKVPILGEMLSGCEGMIVALGVATTLIGFFLGTFFGINIVDAGWIPQTTALGRAMAWLQGDVPGTNYSIQMAGALCIGVFHICLAMVIKALLYTKRDGLKHHLATWGWVLLIVGGVITAVLTLSGVLSEQMMQVVLIVIGAVSALAIYLLNNVDRLTKKPLLGIIVNPLSGLYDTYNMASGLMGDVLSYIRLYALCLAGGMLGGAFNMIGDMVRGDSISWTIIFAVLIYVVGHVFNLLMSSISAFVHPLRLNFVEYFKNSGYEGKGVKYEPLSLTPSIPSREGHDRSDG